MLFLSRPVLCNRIKGFCWIAKDKKQVSTTFYSVSWTKFIAGKDFPLSQYHFAALFCMSHNAFLYISWHFLLTLVTAWFANIYSCHEDDWCILFQSPSPGLYWAGNGSCPVLGESKEVGLRSLFHGSSPDAGRSPWWTWEQGRETMEIRKHHGALMVAFSKLSVSLVTLCASSYCSPNTKTYSKISKK